MTPVAGIDLAGSPRRDTGLCILGRRTIIGIVHTDEEILAWIRSAKARIVAIDAPLSLPRGRYFRGGRLLGSRSIHLRECDRELSRLRIRFFPVTLGPMRMLTRRGIDLAHKLRRLSCHVLETYPGAAQDLWGIPRHSDPQGLQQALARRVRLPVRDLTRDELDGITCALVGRLHARGQAQMIGDRREGLMLLPNSSS